MISISTGNGYKLFDKCIQKFESSIAPKKYTIPLVDIISLKQRIVQKLVSTTLNEFSKGIAMASYLNNGDMINYSPKFLKTDGIVFNLNNAKVLIRPLKFLRLWYEYLGVSIYILFNILTALIFVKTKQSIKNYKCSLILEVGGNIEESDKDFVDFCKFGNIHPLSEQVDFIISTPKLPLLVTSPNFFYCQRPFIFLIREKLNRMALVDILFSFTLNSLRIMKHLILNHHLLMLSSEFSILPIVHWFDKHGIIDSVFITNSSFADQPIWLKGLKEQNFKLHMLWYSQNFIPKVYKDDGEISPLPQTRHMRVDAHWVWTKGFSSYLKSHTKHKVEIKVVGPILFYNPRDVDIPFDYDHLISVFDINPMLSEISAFGAIKNYYSKRTISRFIIDIVKCVEEIQNECKKKIIILIKNKRKFKVGYHDESYFQFLDDIACNNSFVKLLGYDVNLFGLLSKSDVSISVPYTSTAYVSSFLNKPAIYYDPFDELIPKFEEAEDVFFVSNKLVLKELIKSKILLN
jgi:polysaccharide biosynthesis PFTS motif protein